MALSCIKKFITKQLENTEYKNGVSAKKNFALDSILSYELCLSRPGSAQNVFSCILE
jgi:hypothetical protein